MVLTGALRTARPNVTIAIDATDPQGKTITDLVKANASGDYRYDMKLPDVAPGIWRFRAIWQGDLEYSSAASGLVAVAVR